MTDKTTCLATNLRRAAGVATELYNRHLAPSGLNVAMLRLMEVAETHPEASITELAGRLGLDRSTLGRNLRVLERQGMVALGHGRDDRSRGIELTEGGRQALEIARPLWARAQDDLSTRLGGEAAELIRLLERVRGD